MSKPWDCCREKPPEAPPLPLKLSGEWPLPLRGIPLSYTIKHLYHCSFDGQTRPVIYIKRDPEIPLSTVSARALGEFLIEAANQMEAESETT